MGIHMCTKCTFCYALCFLFVFFVCVFVSSFSFSCLHHFVCVFVSSFSFFMFASFCLCFCFVFLFFHVCITILSKSDWRDTIETLSGRDLSVVLPQSLRGLTVSASCPSHACSVEIARSKGTYTKQSVLSCILLAFVYVCYSAYRMVLGL